MGKAVKNAMVLGLLLSGVAGASRADDFVQELLNSPTAKMANAIGADGFIILDGTPTALVRGNLSAQNLAATSSNFTAKAQRVAAQNQVSLRGQSVAVQSVTYGLKQLAPYAGKAASLLVSTGWQGGVYVDEAQSKVRIGVDVAHLNEMTAFMAKQGLPAAAYSVEALVTQKFSGGSSTPVPQADSLRRTNHIAAGVEIANAPTITTGGQCTLGYFAVDANKKIYGITAGHCRIPSSYTGGMANPTFVHPGTGITVGNSISTHTSGVDVSVIDLTTTNYTPNIALAQVSNGEILKWLDSAGAGSPYAGDLYMTGRTTFNRHWYSGLNYRYMTAMFRQFQVAPQGAPPLFLISDTQYCMIMSKGAMGVTMDANGNVTSYMSGVSMSGQPGDSGGPLFSWSGSGTDARVVGIVSNFWSMPGTSDQAQCFTGVDRIQSTYGLKPFDVFNR